MHSNGTGGRHLTNMLVECEARAISRKFEINETINKNIINKIDYGSRTLT